MPTGWQSLRDQMSSYRLLYYHSEPPRHREAHGTRLAEEPRGGSGHADLILRQGASSGIHGKRLNLSVRFKGLHGAVVVFFFSVDC